MSDFDIEGAKKAGYYDDEINSFLRQQNLATSYSKTVLSPNQPEPPTQFIRSALQGLTFKTADEAEAFLRSKTTGEDYDAALLDIRKKLKDYQGARPWESLAAETSGAIPIAVLGSMFTGGGATPAIATSLFPTLARVAGVGAAQGAVTGAGGAEGDLVSRGMGAIEGGLVGGVVAPAAYGVTKAIGTAIIDPVLDFARRQIGGRGAKVVETEIQRIAKDTGLTPDEIVQRIANGETLSENQAVLSTIRGYVGGGGDASNILRESLGRRPTALRQQVVGEMQKELVGGIEPNVLKAFKASEQARKDALNEMYEQAYGQGGVVSGDMLKNFTEALKRSPDAVKNINDLYLATTGTKPFFKMSEAGEIIFERAPTLKDIEIARRGIQANINDKFRGGAGDVASALKPFELNLRNSINESSDALKSARQTASSQKTMTESFDSGRKAFAKSADQVALEFEDLTAKGTDAVSAYRAGIMDQIRNKMSLGGKATMVTNLADPNTKEGAILRIIYPQDKVDDILKLANVASQSQKAAGYVMGGSSTAPTQMAAERIGVNISPQEIASALSGHGFTAMRILGKFIAAKSSNLDPDQKAQVARILVSEDPKIVANALKDTSGMAMLQQKIQEITNRVSRTTPGLLTAPAISTFMRQ